MLKRIAVVGLCFLLVWSAQSPLLAQTEPKPALADLVNKPYLELPSLALAITVSEEEFDACRVRLKREREAEQKRLEREERKLADEVKQLQRRLAELNKQSSSDSPEQAEQRRRIHCRILKLEKDIARLNIERRHAVPTAFDNRLAKLDLIREWPAKDREIKSKLASGAARSRRHGNVEDIRVRVIAEGQEKDIKTGEKVILEMKSYGLMPPEFEDEQVTLYLRTLCERIAAGSDLKIPVRVTVLESDEVNAFALPGGYLFINTGLLEAVRNESELAGVVAHEIAHAAARHGARLMKRATIAAILFEIAQVAALIFTGGVAGIGTYYALQYGFFGLGLVLDLTLLGVNREFEAEADQLGVQYAWRSGYDPAGFITFFDHLASEKGHVRSASFFRTHPPFFDRIFSTLSEIEYLPPTEFLVTDSSQFQATKARLNMLREQRREEDKNRPKPSLKRTVDCDDIEENDGVTR